MATKRNNKIAVKGRFANKPQPKSIIQWHEGAGEYQVKCPRCKDELSAPTLTSIKRSFASHYKTEKCKAHY